MPRWRRTVLGVAAAALLAAAAIAGCADAVDSEPAASAGARVRAALGASGSEGFERALEVRRLRFPRDHGAHPGFRTEWWYFTGNLDDASGERYGFQLTFFRFALAPPPRADVVGQPSGSAPAADAVSPWRTRQAWMGHFALTDVARGRFHAFERFARGAAGLAGARDDRLEVWLEDWSARAELQGGDFPLRLRAAAGPLAVDLRLERRKPMVLQGDRGLSVKSPQPGNASYYYSFTRLAVGGSVSLGGIERPVTGSAWFDREWSTSALASDQTGWDWFALQLDDDRDLMFYRLRAQGGGVHPSSAGVLVEPDGRAHRLRAADMTLTPGERWRDGDGAGYPTVWQLAGAGLDLEVRALVEDQLHRGVFRYWEGAVEVRDRARGGAVSGRGYLEMTPY